MSNYPVRNYSDLRPGDVFLPKKGKNRCLVLECVEGGKRGGYVLIISKRQHLHMWADKNSNESYFYLPESKNGVLPTSFEDPELNDILKNGIAFMNDPNPKKKFDMGQKKEKLNRKDPSR